MKILKDVEKYCNEKVIDSIITGYDKIIGIESNLKITNEKGKYVGTILLLHNAPKKLSLDMIVQFSTDKIKYSASNYNGEFGLYFVDPYWVTSYAPAPKIKVPISVFNIKENKTVTEMADLTFNQFMKSRLFDYYGKFQYRYVAAYENFYNLFKNNQYYYAINSTVKHYKVKQENLVKMISLINNEKKKIKAEWTEHMNSCLQKHQSAKMIEELYGKRSRERKESNVISFKDKS
jgi:hypothetical protein